MSYTTTAQVQAFLAKTVTDSAELARIASYIGYATDLVDRETGQTWQAPTTLATKRVECNGQAVLTIPPALWLVRVVLSAPDTTDDELVEDDDYYVRPGGSGHDAEPATILALQAASGHWPQPPAYLEIEAQWATDAEVPEDIALATAWIVAGWCRAVGIGTSSPAEVKSESWDGYTVSYGDGAKVDSPRSVPPEAAEILQRYALRAGADEPFCEGV